ncbi:MAG: 2-oxo acid dehydrogenase subunit E2 [Candidatus Aminicenantes bacterium]|nr:2-oxo acid dehydrogenase subunit E2 [Candidatus Aminicenantes bacterium]
MTAPTFRIVEFPRSRIATVDIGAIGKRKHYVSAVLELDVTVARERMASARKEPGPRVSFTAWILKVVGGTVSRHKEVAAFRCGRRKLMIFDDVDISIVVEKDVAGRKVPLPLVVRKVQEKSLAEITAEIDGAKAEMPVDGKAVLGQGSGVLERLYYRLPGAIRRAAWRLMLRRPRYVFGKMGNVVVTSVGMMGRVNGWFLQTSIHPVSFGVGSISRKPAVVGDGIESRDILPMTVLIDHDAVDGAPMARFIAALTKDIEAGLGL